MMKVYKPFIISIFLCFTFSCTEDELSETNPFVILKPGAEYTKDGASIPVGGQIKFGISAVGDGAAITNLTVQRITDEEVITELDRGMYIKTGGLDTTVTFVKGPAELETWRFIIMNGHRDTASVSAVINLGEGSAYGEINYFPSITIGFQNNTELPYYIDLHTGNTYNNTTVEGHEPSIDLARYYYLSSGKSSPTLSCPGYETARYYHPEMSSWAVQNSTLYDYETTDYDLIAIEEFDAAQNDSLLVNGYIPGSVSGTCKYCYTDKIIPFKTSDGKYGLIKVLHADEFDTGYMEIAVKIQK